MRQKAAGYIAVPRNVTVAAHGGQDPGAARGPWRRCRAHHKIMCIWASLWGDLTVDGPGMSNVHEPGYGHEGFTATDLLVSDWAFIGVLRQYALKYASVNVDSGHFLMTF